MSEQIDIYDETHARIGSSTRAEAHQKGYWHKAFHCWIIKDNGASGSILFQLRSDEKDFYPNYLDITAAGHLLAGESALDGLREVEEELGIKVNQENLHFLGTRTEVAKVGDILNREFCDTYFLRDDHSLNEYKLQVEEVSGLVEIDIQDGLSLFSGEVDQLKCKAVQFVGGKPIQIECKINKDSVIPRLDFYYLKMFIMAERYLSGNKLVAI